MGPRANRASGARFDQAGPDTACVDLVAGSVLWLTSPGSGGSVRRRRRLPTVPPVVLDIAQIAIAFFVCRSMTRFASTNGRSRRSCPSAGAARSSPDRAISSARTGAPNKRQTGALAGKRRGAVGSVASEHDPPIRPLPHAHLRHFASVEVVRPIEFRQQSSEAPPDIAERGLQRALLSDGIVQWRRRSALAK